MNIGIGRCSRMLLVLIAPVLAPFGSAWGTTVRVVTYNIECSGLGIVAPNSGFDIIIQAIGNHHIAGNAQPVDVLALQELDGVQPAPQGNSATLPYIIDSLNAIYGAGTYSFDPTTDPTDGDSVGNGPSGLVYNTHTIQVINARIVGSPPSGSGAARQPMRYQLRPFGYGPEADVYLYVSHYKASSGSTNQNRRNVEASQIRQNADILGPNAHVIYSGDLNFTGGSSEPAYQTLISSGYGRAYDPDNGSNNWTNSSTWKAILTESATSLTARFDFQLVNAATLIQYGFQLGSDGSDSAYQVFGNNGTTSFGGSTNNAGNTSLNDLPNKSQVLSLLTTVSDHLPVVADYNIVINPAPAITTQPGNQLACAGSSTSFTVTASGNPSPSFRWYLGATPLSNGGAISGADTATLTINPVGPGDAASNYNCVATNTVNTATSNNATLTVTANSPTLSPISNDSVLCGAAYTSPAPSINAGTTPVTWTLGAGARDGMTIDPSTGVVSWNTPITVGSPFTVTTTASNSCGTDSRNWLLTVFPNPPSISPISNATASCGVSYTSPIPAVSGGAAPLTWSLLNGPVGMTIDTTTGSITWSSPDESGNPYTVTVQAASANACGVDSKTWTLTVGGSLSFYLNPEPQAICAGQSVVLIGTAAGDPPIQYQWRHDGQNIPGANGQYLSLDEATPADSGSYDVVATNVCFSATSTAALLTVFPSATGDGNGDAHANGRDIAGFVNTILSFFTWDGTYTAAYCAYDMNADGIVDPADIDGFVAKLLGP